MGLSRRNKSVGYEPLNFSSRFSYVFQFVSDFRREKIISFCDTFLEPLRIATSVYGGPIRYQFSSEWLLRIPSTSSQIRSIVWIGCSAGISVSNLIRLANPPWEGR